VLNVSFNRRVLDNEGQTMNAVINQAEHRKPDFNFVKLLLQGAFAVGMLALILIGAAFFLAGAEFTQHLQIITAAAGAILGAFSAGLFKRVSSQH
jgi:hypothetical protein